MSSIRRPLPSPLLGGMFLAFLIGTWATAANGQGTTKINSPTDGSPVTFTGSQMTFGVEVAIDKTDPTGGWAYYGYIVNQVTNGVTKPIDSSPDRQTQDIYVGGSMRTP